MLIFWAVVIISGDRYQFSADSEQEKIDWIQVLQDASRITVKSVVSNCISDCFISEFQLLFVESGFDCCSGLISILPQLAMLLLIC